MDCEACRQKTARSHARAGGKRPRHATNHGLSQCRSYRVGLRKSVLPVDVDAQTVSLIEDGDFTVVDPIDGNTVQSISDLDLIRRHDLGELPPPATTKNDSRIDFEAGFYALRDIQTGSEKLYGACSTPIIKNAESNPRQPWLKSGSTKTLSQDNGPRRIRPRPKQFQHQRTPPGLTPWWFFLWRNTQT